MRLANRLIRAGGMVGAGGGGGPATAPILDAGALAYNETGSGWTRPIPLGSNGDLLLAVSTNRGTSDSGFDLNVGASFAEIFKSASLGDGSWNADMMAFLAAFREANGTEGSTLPFDSGTASRENGSAVLRIRNWDTTKTPVVAIWEGSPTGDKVTTVPTPTISWGWSAPTLVLLGAFNEEDRTVATRPTGYTVWDTVAGGKLRGEISYREVSASPENPGDYSWSGNARSICWAIAIPGA